MRQVSIAALAGLAVAACGGADAPAPVAEDIRVDHPRVFPESVTSTDDGTIIVGSTQGRVFRAGPDETVATAWIEADDENGIQSVFGVLAHDASDTLWLCSASGFGAGPAGPTSLKAFDLDSGAFRASYEFPGGTGTCNDAEVGADGTVYAADTSGARIVMLAPGADALTVFGEDPALQGVDGIVFSEDGVLYVNNVQANTLLRLDIGADGMMAGLHELELSQPVSGPDGMRLIEGSRFLLAEGQAGQVDEVVIEGDRAEIRVLRDGLDASPGVTYARGVAYAIEGKIGYLFNPDLQDQDPGDFMVYAVPLDAGETQ